MSDSAWKRMWESYMMDLYLKYGDFKDFIGNTPTSKFNPNGVPIIETITAHNLRHPYVKHTTKIYFCKSRNPKPPNTTDGLGFLFLLSYIPVNWHQILVI